MKPSVLLPVLLFFCLGLTVPSAALGEESEESRVRFDTFTFYMENDFFAGTDRDYTNGLKLTWSTPFFDEECEMGRSVCRFSLLRLIPFAYAPGADHALTISLGQAIYTPKDVTRSDLIVDDRPYAGHLYVGAGIHNRTGSRRHSWELNLGVVGPASYADDLQRWLHKETGSDPANGWGNQLDNEPTLDLIFETRWIAFRKEVSARTTFDLITHLGARAGNVAIYANAGGEVRYGWNLPNDFGIGTIRNGGEINSAFNAYPRNKQGGMHFFAGVDGRAVAWDLFLDGNTFADSHSVEREPLVGDLIVGLAFEAGAFRSTYSYIFQTRQFEGHDSSPDYGSITFSFSF